MVYLSRRWMSKAWFFDFFIHYRWTPALKALLRPCVTLIHTRLILFLVMLVKKFPIIVFIGIILVVPLSRISQSMIATFGIMMPWVWWSTYASKTRCWRSLF
jgi:hypothetical protein